MIKKILAGMAMALAIALPAQAADHGAVETRNVDWTGFYAGVFAGYRTGNIVNTQCTGTCGTNMALNGFAGGLDAGYDAEIGDDWVAGAYLTLPLIKPTAAPNVPPFGVYNIDPQWAVAAGGRLGKEITNGVLLYGHAGFALANITVSDGTNAPNATHLGVVAGAGVEAMATSNLSIDTRYTFGYMGEGAYNFGCGAACTSRYTETSHNFTVGAHWRFD